MTDTDKYHYSPSADHPWFASDPSDGDIVYFATEQEAIDCAKRMIDSHNQDGWSEEVDQIIVGKVTHYTAMVNLVKRPKREDFFSDEDFQDACDEYPDMDYDYCCNYEPLPLSEKGAK